MIVIPGFSGIDALGAAVRMFRPSVGAQGELIVPGEPDPTGIAQNDLIGSGSEKLWVKGKGFVELPPAEVFREGLGNPIDQGVERLFREHNQIRKLGLRVGNKKLLLAPYLGAEVFAVFGLLIRAARGRTVIFEQFTLLQFNLTTPVGQPQIMNDGSPENLRSRELKSGGAGRRQKSRTEQHNRQDANPSLHQEPV